MRGQTPRQIIVDDPEAVDCVVTFTALAAVRADKWEASCPCGFWTKGTKAECEQRANGHPPRRV